MAILGLLNATKKNCPIHNISWAVFQDDEIERTYGPRLIFFCREPGCDYFDWEHRRGSANEFEIADFFLAQHFMKLFKIERKLRPSREEVAMITQLFINAVRSKIIFHRLRCLFAAESKI